MQATGYTENIRHTAPPADHNRGQRPSSDGGCDFSMDFDTVRTKDEQPLLEFHATTVTGSSMGNKGDRLLTRPSSSNLGVAAADSSVQQSQLGISHTDSDDSNCSVDLMSSDDDDDFVMAAMAAEQEQMTQELASDCDGESGDNDIADDCICIIKSEGVDDFVDCVADMKQFTSLVNDSKPGALFQYYLNVL